LGHACGILAHAPGRISLLRVLYRRFNISSFEAVANDESVRLPPGPEELTPAVAPPGRLRLASEPAPARKPLGQVLLRAARPRQWSKNLLVLAAPCAAGVIDRPLVAAQVLGAFVVLCLLSSATYLINDVRDLQQDRLHPRKRSRPIAAGEISTRTALRTSAVLALLGIAGATAITPSLGLVAVGYLALTASYSLLWRRVVVADILAIAAGFVLRAIAGGVATDIYLSRWFVIVTASCAIFLVAAKRYAELREHVGPGPVRATLRRYSITGLRLLLLAASSTGGVAYVAWAFTRPTHVAWYALSIAPFLLWLARYGSLVGAGAGQAPEELILRDRALMALSVIWALLFLGGVYVGR
jgi:decaprenyl-phosphate phosphoribosyltransferase